MNQENILIPGWYGKIPSLGDFASRRLPANFIKIWDTWLQQSIETSRLQLGECWLEIYLTSPIWRFILMPGVCDNSLYTGILMPSVDKVARYFPLTIAIEIKYQPSLIFNALKDQSWYIALEKVAINSLDINKQPDDLELELSNYPLPLFYELEQANIAMQFVEWWHLTPLKRKFFHKNMLTLTTENTLMSLYEAAASDMLISSGIGKSIWWNVSPDTQKTQLMSFVGLPPDSHFSNFLEGVAH